MALAALVLRSAPAAAAGNPLDGKQYSLDIFQGPILAPSDVIGTAGAYAGVAEGIAGMAVNAAAPAVRDIYNVNYFSWDFSPSISIPLNLFGPRDDFADAGTAGPNYADFISISAGGLIQYGSLGMGLDAQIQRYSLASPASKAAPSISTAVTLGKYQALVAYTFLGDQLSVGVGARIASLSLVPGDTEQSLTIFGAAPEIGVLVRPDWQSFRLGLTMRFPVHGGRLLGPNVTQAGGLDLPDDVVLPWELELGAAIQVGPRPLNPPWIDPHAQEETLHRSFLLRRRRRERDDLAELARIGDPATRMARQKEIVADEAARQQQEEVDEARIARTLQDDRRARAQNWPREHLLLTMELLVTGAVGQGVSLQSFLGQNQPGGATTVGSSGASVNYSPRAGVETEPIPGRMHTRAGSYYEPNRFGTEVGRQHFTFGADVKVFSTTWFGLVPRTTYKAQAYADFSPRYQSVSAGVGVWP